MRTTVLGVIGWIGCASAPASSDGAPAREDATAIVGATDSAAGRDTRAVEPDASATADATVPAADAEGPAPVVDAGGAPGGLSPAGFACPPGAHYGAPVPASARATTLRSGFMEAEGPVWLAAQKVLLVSDINEKALGEGRVMKYTPATDQWEVVVSHVGTNGMAIDASGGVVAACHDVQQLMRLDPMTGGRTPLPGGTQFEGKPFNELNDVVVRSDGNLYFTDPSLQPGAKGRAGQGVTAYYRLSPQGTATRIAVAAQPNGIALSPDGRFLYVAGGHPLRRHAIAADGSVATEFDVLNASGSDGMAVDCAGNLYLTTGSGVLVLGSDGARLGAITVPSSGYMTNVAFGGDDRQTLFITTRYAVHQIHLDVPGFPN